MAGLATEDKESVFFEQGGVCCICCSIPVPGGACKLKCSLQRSPWSTALQPSLDFALLCMQVWLPTPAQNKGVMLTDLKSSIWYLFGRGRVQGQVKV